MCRCEMKEKIDQLTYFVFQNTISSNFVYLSVYLN